MEAMGAGKAGLTTGLGWSREAPGPPFRDNRTKGVRNQLQAYRGGSIREEVLVLELLG